jgi:predicted DNA binding CopG/RHH family protein
MKKLFQKFKTNKQMEELLEGDMSEYIHSGNFTPASFEFMPKTEKVNLRLSPSLLKAVKKKADKNHVPYQRFIRQVLEQAVL